MPASPPPRHARITLANGLQVALCHAPHLKRCAAALRVAVGSHDAPLEWPGLAHFLEHLLFLGTAAFAAGDGLMAHVQRHGGQVNAKTCERTTEFFFEVAPTAFAAGLERLVDMLAKPRLDVAEQLREREVLEAEYSAWSGDEAAQRQLRLYTPLPVEHPLRGFHAGNRASLLVEEAAFQHALQTFHQMFYQAGQMSLSLAGPQSLAQLEALARAAAAGLGGGPHRPRQVPPALPAARYRTLEGLRLNLLLSAPAVPGDAAQGIDFLCLWLNDRQAGGLAKHLENLGWIDSLQAQPLYHFAGQALWHIEIQLRDAGAAQVDHIVALLDSWLAFFAAQADWQALREEYRLLLARRAQTASALDLARRAHDEQQEQLSSAGLEALTAVLAQAGGGPPAVRDDAAGDWRLPTANPFLRSADSSPHLAPGPASARRAAALHYSQVLVGAQAALAGEAAIYLRWQLHQRRPTGRLHGQLEHSLAALREQARQAGVNLAFSAQAESWQLKLSGFPEPLPAIAGQALQRLGKPSDTLWQDTPQAQSAAPIPIRQLLRHLLEPVQEHTTGQPLWGPDDLQTLWASAHWHGLAVGLDGPGQAALDRLLGSVPGIPASGPAPLPAPTAGKHWQSLVCDPREQALLLFCPAPRTDLASEGAWRLLGQLLQAPFYQRLRVELQLGYAVFSAVRQVEGQVGLLLGVQSPQASLGDILGHIEPFLGGLAQRIEATSASTWNDWRNSLAAQFDPHGLPPLETAELQWQAHLAHHSSDYFAQLRAVILALQPSDLLDAAAQLNQAAGGWRCLANGPCPAPHWRVAK